MSELELRLDKELERLVNNYKKRGVRHNGYNSGDLRRIQALVYIKSGLRRALWEIDQDIKEGVNFYDL